MDSRHRDGLLAAVGLIVVVAVGVRIGAIEPFLDPFPAAVGVVGSVGLEVAFLRYPEGTTEVWERPGVAPGALVLVVALGVGAVATGATWIVGTLAWGLLAYLVLLGCVLAGVGNPLGAVANR